MSSSSGISRAQAADVDRDAAPSSTAGSPKLLFDPRQNRHSRRSMTPRRTRTASGAILWETATGKVIGRYQGRHVPGVLGSAGYLQLERQSGKPMLISLKTGEARAIPGVHRFHFGVGLGAGLPFPMTRLGSERVRPHRS